MDRETIKNLILENSRIDDISDEMIVADVADSLDFINLLFEWEYRTKADISNETATRLYKGTIGEAIDFALALRAK